jgi:serine protease
MPGIARLLLALACGGSICVMSDPARAAVPEWNPVRSHNVQLGPEASRLVVGFRATPGNTVVKTIKPRARAQSIKIVQANTSDADVAGLAQRTGLAMARSRQMTPSMHVVFLQKTLYGTGVNAVLKKLRTDPAVQFADVDQRRYVHAVPDDPLFVPTAGASGQWFMQTPSAATITLGGTLTEDLSATDAISAWAITTGSTGTVIADVDTGVRFDHPDLLRAGFGGRLLPGYDFVDQDYNPTTGAALGTFLIANDGDGWDPDPSDPGDWINSTDQQNTTLFPAANCAIQDSSWHGTRVMGVLGALTNNGTGVAGMTWNPYLLPVRALGKCGGYDSDIIAGMQWAAGMSVTGVPDNPYPADIINLSLGGTGSCPSIYQSVVTTLTTMGVLVVASAGNENGPVDAPGNCSGVLAVAGLRNVGTKVGYSSFGAEVGVAAPAGNCVNTSGACLRSIDTTFNTGLTVPAVNSYTDQIIPNLGTSFSAPIVSGIAGLMRAVNANLTPAQLISRIKSSASPFPPPTGGLPQCPTLSSSGECACVQGQCGAGMVNALSAVNAALKPIAAVSFPATFAANAAVAFDASGSAASCNRAVQSYAWSAGSGITILSGAGTAQVSVSGTGILTLTVTDSLGSTDTATITVSSTSATTTAPSTAGTHACPTALAVNPSAPTIAESFAPASVGVTVASTLTITLSNSNAFDLTQSNLTTTLPSSLSIATSAAASTTCTGATGSLTTTTSSVTLTGAIVPAKGSCSVTLTVSSATAGSYTNSIAASALMTGPAGGNTAAATATLTVTAPIAPTISAAFSPSSVSVNAASTLTITLSNKNAYALTQAALTDTLPGNLSLAASPAASTTCSGSLSTTTGSAKLTGGSIPASGSCTVTMTVSSGTAGSYTNTNAANALATAQNTSNTAAASASLTVTAPSSGGGALDWLDMMFVVGVLLAGRRHTGRRSSR